MKSKSLYSITEAFNNVDRLDASYWKALVSNSLPGQEIISGSPALAPVGQPKLQDLRLVIEFVSRNYQWTVTDAGRGMSDSIMTAVKASEAVCLVTTAEILPLHQTRLILQRLMDAPYLRERVRSIVNKVPKRHGTRPEGLQEMMGIPVFPSLPACYLKLHEAQSMGRLLCPKTGLGNSVGRLARKLAGAGEPQAKRRLPFFGQG